MSLNLSMSIWSAQESAQSFRQAASRHIDIQHSWCWLGASSLNTTLFTVDVSCKKCTLSCIAIISLHYTTVSRNINKRGQALPSGQFDIWHPWSETWASSYIRQMVAGGVWKWRSWTRSSACHNSMQRVDTKWYTWYDNGQITCIYIRAIARMSDAA